MACEARARAEGWPPGVPLHGGADGVLRGVSKSSGEGALRRVRGSARRLSAVGGRRARSWRIASLQPQQTGMDRTAHSNFRRLGARRPAITLGDRRRGGAASSARPLTAPQSASTLGSVAGSGRRRRAPTRAGSRDVLARSEDREERALEPGDPVEARGRLRAGPTAELGAPTEAPEREDAPLVVVGDSLLIGRDVLESRQESARLEQRVELRPYRGGGALEVGEPRDVLSRQHGRVRNLRRSAEPGIGPAKHTLAQLLQESPLRESALHVRLLHAGAGFATRAPRRMHANRRAT